MTPKVTFQGYIMGAAVQLALRLEASLPVASDRQSDHHARAGHECGGRRLPPPPQKLFQKSCLAQTSRFLDQKVTWMIFLMSFYCLFLRLVFKSIFKDFRLRNSCFFGVADIQQKNSFSGFSIRSFFDASRDPLRLIF